MLTPRPVAAAEECRMPIFRPLFDPTSSTWTYLLGDRASGEAVLIDPVFEQVRRDETLVRELGLTLVWTLETHVHADHVTGAWLLRQRLGSRIALSVDGGASGADRLLKHGDRVAFGGRHLEVRSTPGHTNGCLSYVLDDELRVFTGDCLLIRGCGRTDFQQGDAAALYRSVHMQLFTLPAECLVYPGHDYNGMGVSSIAEERRFNPRLGGDVGERDFLGFMQHLNLPHPKKMDAAVPANLRCGRPEGDLQIPADPQWAPLSFTIAGSWDIAPHALAEVLHRVQVVDVRDPEEFGHGLGHIDGARLVPLGQLESRQAELPRDRPIVTVCRSGARSARAAAMLAKAGFAQVANLRGGMLRWRAEGGAVVGAGE
jgi:glyoxylase-like metal-dependent hydrolase (beta-lactamase superfamily II)/rhodanese-related sulfurtransferase